MTRDLPVSPTPGQPLRAENVGFRRAVREEANALYDELGSDKAAAFDRFMRDLGPVVVSRFAARLVSAEPDRAEGGEGQSDLEKVERAITAQPGVRLCNARGQISIGQIARAVLSALSSSPSQQQAGAVAVDVASLRHDLAKARAYRDGLRAGFQMGEHGEHERYRGIRDNLDRDIGDAASEVKTTRPTQQPGAAVEVARKALEEARAEFGSEPFCAGCLDSKAQDIIDYVDDALAALTSSEEV